MPPSEREPLLQTLKARFTQHMHRHKGLAWADVLSRLDAAPSALAALAAMEASGGEPDVIGLDPADRSVIFCDCAAESPLGRRSLCYDGMALAARKENRPEGSAVESAARARPMWRRPLSEPSLSTRAPLGMPARSGAKACR